MNIIVRAQESTDAEAMLKVIHSQRVYSGTLQLPFYSLDAMRKRMSEVSEGVYRLVAEVEGKLWVLLDCTFNHAPPPCGRPLA